MKANVPSLFPNSTVATRVLEYASSKSSSLPEPLLKYHAEILNLERSNMSISTYQAQAMSFLAQAAGAKRILEIGVFRGFSAMVWATVVGPHGTVTGLEKFPEYAGFARKAVADLGFKNVDIIEGDALETLAALSPEEPYDLIFIDAQKSGYPDYLKTILSKSTPGASHRLLRPGGLIIADNVLRLSVVADPSPENPQVAQLAIENGGTELSPRIKADIAALDEFNTALHASERVDAWLMPLFDGVNLGRLLD